MRIVTVIFQLAGSLALLMYGMKMLGEGIQKSAGNSLHRFLTVMTSNRFAAVFTGCFITMIIQSSGATTVMVVSFVNAGLITLQQSVGVIFGANIGTTVTAWIVALFGFQFNIAAAAIPVFGVGYLIKYVRKIKKESAGEALMGFGLLFLGLDFLSALSPGADNAAVLNVFQNGGTVSILLGMLGGLLITAIIHSSSAATAVILTLCRNGVLHWEFAAAMVLGCGIGIDGHKGKCAPRSPRSRAVQCCRQYSRVYFFPAAIGTRRLYYPGHGYADTAFPRCHAAYLIQCAEYAFVFALYLTNRLVNRKAD